jgi:peptide deformylase
LIIKYPDEKLSEISEPVFPNLTQKEAGDLIANMRKACWDVGGFAISAIQIGSPYTVLGYFSFKTKEYNWIIDPQIISTNGSNTMQEGCLSIPGYFWNIERPSKVCISYKDIDQVERVRTFTGVIARAILHEMDHFDGILIPDFMDDNQLKDFNRHYSQYSHVDEYSAPNLNAA